MGEKNVYTQRDQTGPFLLSPPSLQCHQALQCLPYHPDDQINPNIDV